ncbi:isochorismatase hydrolase [Hymenopellis radicata]|nr:isochorismatase hydrolase [Hymenopellis radicata]
MSSFDVQKDYTNAGFGHRIGWGKRPALVVIDMCKAYFLPGSPLTIPQPVGDVPGECKQLVEAARASGVPIIWTRQITHKSMYDGGIFYMKIKEPAQTFLTHYGEQLDDLQSSPDEIVISKQYPSAFFGTSLSSTLTSHGIDTVIVCGVSTSGCVRASTLDAMQHGFRPMVVGTACGDRTPEIQKANLFDMDSKMADVVTLEEALSKIKAGWST